jgi:GxxExxY protein
MGLPYEDKTYQILGACFEVYEEKGPGSLEAVYQESMAIEFPLRDIPLRAKVDLKLDDKGRILKQTYQPDFILLDKIMSSLPTWPLPARTAV